MNDFIILLIGALLAAAFYWSFYLLPSRRELRKRQKNVSAMNPGDEVITFGGLIGHLVNIDSDRGVAHIEISDGVVIRIMIAALMQTHNPAQISENVVGQS